jgi:hypothetical protein
MSGLSRKSALLEEEETVRQAFRRAGEMQEHPDAA